MKHSARPSVTADPLEWSPASKRSGEYVFPPAEYRDISYQCRCCNRPAVFTAEEQRHAFEVRKTHVLQVRVLCAECFAERSRLEQAARAYAHRWKHDRENLQRDRAALQEWLQALERLPQVGASRSSAHVAMVQRLLNNVA